MPVRQLAIYPKGFRPSAQGWTPQAGYPGHYERLFQFNRNAVASIFPSRAGATPLGLEAFVPSVAARTRNAGLEDDAPLGHIECERFVTNDLPHFVI
jgi:hypothetical protein